MTLTKYYHFRLNPCVGKKCSLLMNGRGNNYIYEQGRGFLEVDKYMLRLRPDQYIYIDLNIIVFNNKILLR